MPAGCLPDQGLTRRTSENCDPMVTKPISSVQKRCSSDIDGQALRYRAVSVFQMPVRAYIKGTAYIYTYLS
jgi:hypothetical protein